jgi:hypothetical protein
MVVNRTRGGELGEQCLGPLHQRRRLGAPFKPCFGLEWDNSAQRPSVIGVAAPHTAERLAPSTRFEWRIAYPGALQEQVALARITSERRRHLEFRARFAEATELAKKVAPHTRQ